MKSFDELDARDKAHGMVLAVHRPSGSFPKEERFGVVSQLRRAAASVPANIAEGFGRRWTKDFLRYLEVAGGSLEETRYFLRLSKDLDYLKDRSSKYCAKCAMRRVDYLGVSAKPCGENWADLHWSPGTGHWSRANLRRET